MRKLRSFVPFAAASVGMAGLVNMLGCNPLIYDKLLEDVYVSSFRMRGPTGSPTHSSTALTFGADDDGTGHVLMASPDDASMVWLSLSTGAEAVEHYPSVEDLQALIFPLEGAQKVSVGGLARVPAPEQGDKTPHAVVVYLAPGDPENARVVRFDLPRFERTDDNEIDIVNPMIDGSPVPNFGTGLAAINLDGAQDEPEYEVAVGSEAGVLVFDSVGANLEAYLTAKAAMGAACTAENEPNCFHFTRCEQIGVPTQMTQGLFLSGNGPAIVAATEAGLTFIADKETPEQNAVGAPVYDCQAEFWAAPSGASESYGRALFVNDLNDDGNDDLVVGDPGAGRVHIHMGNGDGISQAPTLSLEPTGEQAPTTFEFGFSIGRADLGATIGSVLLVGAPGSNVGGELEVGKVFVYKVTGIGDPITVLGDDTPEKNTRYGIWVGGIRIDDRDELVISGTVEAKIYVAINEFDPHAG